MDKQKLLAEINSYTYEQYDTAWCKGDYISDVYSYNTAGAEVLQKYLRVPNNLDNQLALIRLYIEDNLTLFTPESFIYHRTLRDSNWTLVSKEEAITTLNLIVEYSLFKVEQQKMEAHKEREEWLSYFDINSIAAYENASDEIKATVNLASFYEMNGLSPNGEPRFEFIDFEALQITFSEALFNKEPAFFTNMSSDTVMEALKEEKVPPTIIGMDEEKIAMFWFNF